MAVNLRGLFGKFSSGTATVTTHSVGNVTPVTLAPSNPDRLGVTIYNDAGNLLIKLGTGVSTTNYTHKMPLASVYTIGSEYTGPITAIKLSGTTSVFVTIIV